MSEEPKSDGLAYRRKIVTLPALLAGLARMRGDGEAAARQTVVQCHGCFDIVHPGHIRYLQFARSLGDVLIVSITGDAQISKGDQRPYIPEELRAENLAALAFVDYVVIDPHETAVEILSVVRPDVYVKGQEYAASHDPRFIAERAAVESAGGRVVFSSGQVVFSSTRLAEAIAGAGEGAADRLGVVCRRHGIDGRRLGALLEAIRGRPLLVIGESALERYVACDVSAASGEAPMMALAALGERRFIGEAGAVALAAAALGARTTLVTALGRDAASGELRRSLESAGVRVEAFCHRGEAVVRTRYVADEQKLFRVDRAAAMPLDSVSERAVLQTVEALAADAGAVLIHDCGLGFVTPALRERLAERFAGSDIFMAWSIGGQGDARHAARADLICASERRLRAAAGNATGGLSAVAYELMQATRATRMLATVAKRGVVAFDRRSHDPQSADWGDRLASEYFPALADRAVDRLGCGEAAAAAATLAMSAGASLMQAAYLASAAAAVQIGRIGIVPATTDELARWLSGRRELAASDISSPRQTSQATVTHPGAPAIGQQERRLPCADRPMRTAPPRKAPHAGGV